MACLTFHSEYDAYRFLEEKHPGYMKRWHEDKDLDLDYENVHDFQDMLMDVEDVLNNLGYKCEVTYLGFGDMVFVIKLPQIDRIQRAWRRYCHNHKYEEFYAKILSVPAKHPSKLGEIFPEGGYEFKKLQREVIEINNRK